MVQWLGVYIALLEVEFDSQTHYQVAHIPMEVIQHL